MELTLIKKPHEFSFSGSPIAFTFVLTPYRIYDQDHDIRLQFRVLIERSFRSDIYELAYEEQKLPSPDGRIDFELQTVIDPYIKHALPDTSIILPEVAQGQSLRFKIEYSLIRDGEPVLLTASDYTDTTSPFTVIKGGMSYPLWSPVMYFYNIVNHKHFLGIDSTVRKVFTNQLLFCYVLAQREAGAGGFYLNTYTFIYAVTGSDGIVYSKTVTASDDLVSFYPGNIIIVPAGYNQMELGDLLPDGVLPVSYTVKVHQQIGFSGGFEEIDLAIAYFEIDHRQFYNYHDLFYYNSAGGLNSLRLRGQVEFEAEYEKQEARAVGTPDYFTNGIPDAQTLILKPEETQKSKGATGFLTKDEAEKLRDIFLSQEVYEYKHDKLVPVVINNNNVKFYANRDSLISLMIEWSDAYKSQWYTPAAALVDSLGGFCPAVESLKVIQYGSNKLQISYALQQPYDRAEVEITIGLNVYTYIYQGNVNVVLQEFINPLDDTDPPLEIEVKIRTVCALNSFGAWLTTTLNITYELMPVANNDVFEVPGGLTAPLALIGSILENDYHPDGSTIEADVETAAATAQGGTVDIDINGNVTYEPPSPSFTGQDSFVYTMRKTGAATGVTATILFNVRDTVVNVYAKIEFVNVREFNQYERVLGIAIRVGTYLTADVYMKFFQDPQGQIPLNVNGKNIDFNYRRTRTDILPGAATSSSDSSINSDFIFPRFRVFQKIVIQNETISWNKTAAVEGPKTKWNITYNMLPGTGYIII
jgi:ribosomal protein L21E